MDVESLLQVFLLYVVIPAWLCAGLADWACHRASQIETTSGTKESVLHIAQLSEVGLPLLAGLFFEVNAFVIGAMVVAVVLHHATAIWDVRWANSTRAVLPVEQHVHSILEMAPIVVFAGLAILNWPSVIDLMQGHLSISLAPKKQPLPSGYLAAVIVCVVAMGVVPYVEELLRCLRVSRARPG